MKLTTLIPNPDDLLALTPEELAGYILEYLHSLPPNDRSNFNRYNFSLSHTVADYPTDKAGYCQQALMEAWSVLEREGLLVPKAADNNGWYVFSRRAALLKNRSDYAAFSFSNTFPKASVHPELAQKTYPLFLRGDYETAIFQAFKSVEVAVRNAVPGLDTKLYGVDLMRKAFHAENGPLTDMQEPVAEREALQSLFAGAIGRFKNPTSHRHVPVTNASEAVEVLMFASHLMRVVGDRATNGPHAA
jgi:uncharacterized protein (TIGR02391 family)